MTDSASLAWHIPVYFVALVVGGEACRRLPLVAVLLVWLIAPLALLPLWVDNSIHPDWAWFLWAKTYSVTTGVVWVMCCRLWREKMHPKLVQLPIFVILAINILEAVAKGATSGNYLNPIAGVLLIATMGLPSAISVDTEGKYRDFLYKVGTLWILAYIIWNFTFVWSNWESRPFGRNIAVLASSVALAAIGGWDTWLQARALTLGLHLLFYDSFIWDVQAAFDATAWFSEGGRTAAQIISLCATVIFLALNWWLGRPNWEFANLRRSTIDMAGNAATHKSEKTVADPTPVVVAVDGAGTTDQSPRMAASLEPRGVSSGSAEMVPIAAGERDHDSGVAAEA